MREILQSGIENILWLQQFQTEHSYELWEIFTNFGGTYYLYMVPAIVWVIDYRMGLRLLSMLTLTLVLNAILKEVFAQPRPFEFDARVVSPGELGYGLPSGHAQLAVVFWGVLAGWVDRRPFWFFAISMMFLMGLSRVILGVHFPTDVLLGWVLGGLTLWAYFRYQIGFEGWFVGLAPGRQALWVVAAAGGSFLCVGVVGTELVLLGAGAAGMILGGGLGGIVAARVLSFEGHGPVWKRIVRYVLGLAVLLVFLGTVSGLEIPEGVAGGLLVIAELTIFGAWLTLGAPWLFERLRLSRAPGVV